MSETVFSSINKTYAARKKALSEDAFITESVLHVEEVIPGSDEELDDVTDVDSVPEEAYQKVNALLDKIVNDPKYDDSEAEELVDDDVDENEVTEEELDAVLDEGAGWWINDMPQPMLESAITEKLTRIEKIADDKPDDGDAKEAKRFIEQHGKDIKDFAEMVEKEPDRINSESINLLIAYVVSALSIFFIPFIGFFVGTGGMIYVIIKAIKLLKDDKDRKTAIDNLSKIKRALNKVDVSKLSEADRKNISRAISAIEDAEDANAKTLAVRNENYEGGGDMDLSTMRALAENTTMNPDEHETENPNVEDLPKNTGDEEGYEGNAADHSDTDRREIEGSVDNGRADVDRSGEVSLKESFSLSGLRAIAESSEPVEDVGSFAAKNQNSEVGDFSKNTGDEEGYEGRATDHSDPQAKEIENSVKNGNLPDMQQCMGGGGSDEPKAKNESSHGLADLRAMAEGAVAPKLWYDDETTGHPLRDNNSGKDGSENHHQAPYKDPDQKSL